MRNTVIFNAAILVREVFYALPVSVNPVIYSSCKTLHSSVSVWKRSSHYQLSILYETHLTALF